MSGRAFALLTATIEISKTIPPHEGGYILRRVKVSENNWKNKLKTS